MGIFSKKKQELTLSEKMAGIKSLFTTAYTEAEVLQSEIEDELQAQSVTLAELESDIKSNEKLKKENETFMSNLKKLI